jgi:two-component system sporulation sensor kinase A
VNRKILLVEDDYKFRRWIIDSFEGSDYAFLEASSVSGGLRLTEEHPGAQVVILDLELPGGTGAKFLEGIKARVSDYRVIVLTAHDELLAAERAKSYEVFSYVAKADNSLRESLRFQVERAFEDIERAWLRKKINAHLDIEKRIAWLGRVAGTDPDQKLKDVLELICEHALSLTDAYTCHIRLFDPAKGDFVLWASKGRVGSTESVFSERVRHSEAYSGIVAETKRPLRVDDLQNDPPFMSMKEAALAGGDVEPHYRRYLDTARSAYIVPISAGIFGRDIDAVFNINSDVKAFFVSKAKRKLAFDFVTQTALAVTKHLLRKKRIEIHSDYKNISEMLEEVSDVLKGEVNLKEIYNIVFNGISAGLKPEVISIFLLDKTTNRLRNVAEFPASGRPREDGRPRAAGESFGCGEALVGKVFETGEPIRRVIPPGQIADAALAAALAQEDMQGIPSGALRHYLCVPIKDGDDNRIGCIRAVNKKSELYGDEQEERSNWLLKRGFSDDCQLELQIAASHLAAAIKNAELFGQLNKKVSQLEAIHTVGQRISSRMSMNAVLELIAGEAARVVNAEICMLFLRNEKGDRVVLKKCFGMPPIEGASYEMNEGNTGMLAQTEGYILEPEASARRGKYDDQIEEFLRSRHGVDAGIKSFMAVSIVGKGRILGVFKVINKVEAPFRFDEDDLKLFQVFASRIGLETFLDMQTVRKNIVDNSPDPIIILDEDGRVEFFNNLCEELWGYTNEEAIGRSVVDFYESEAHAHAIGKMLWEAEGHQKRNIKARIKTKSGDIITVSLSATLFLDGEGRKTGSMGVFKDLRELDQMRYQVLQTETDAKIGRLTHSLSHDIKTKIATALNYIEVLRYESGGDEQADLSQAEKALWGAIEILQKLIQEVQPKPPQKRRTSVAGIFADVSGTMSRQAEIKNVDFIPPDYPDGSRQLLLDVDQIQLALLYLFNNSLDAINDKRGGGGPTERGRISVSARLEADVLELTWEDNGCGIPAENVPKLFQPFFTTKEQGNGLGLHGVKEVVEGHGGRVWVESTVVGAGTRFKLTLPISDEQVQEARD